MNTDPRVSPWAQRFVVDEDDEPRDVAQTTRDYIRNKQRDYIADRDRHLHALGGRGFYCVGSALFGIFIPPLAVVGWALAVGWGIAAGISLFEAIFSQFASAVGFKD